MSRLGRLLKPESHEHQELRLQLSPPEAMEACRDAVRVLGWEAIPGPPGQSRLTVNEDFTKLLSCGDWPVRLEIELRPEAGGRHSTVNVEAIVPGVGGVAARQLRRGTRAFAISLARRSAAAAK